MASNMLEEIIQAYSDESFIAYDGLEGALLGVCPNTMRLIYSVGTIIEILMEQGMSDEEALEYYGHNIECAYMGDKTPILCDDTFSSDEHFNN